MGEEIDDGGHIEPALRRPYVRKVCNPFAVGSRRFEGAVEHVRSNGARLPLTQIGRQATPSRTRPQSLKPHQSLDPMQSARHAVNEHIVPHAPGAVGSIARKEACPHLRGQLFIAPGARAAWPCQPSIEPTPRDTERPAQPLRRPDPPVLRDEAELHVNSFAK